MRNVDLIAHQSDILKKAKAYLETVPELDLVEDTIVASVAAQGEAYISLDALTQQCHHLVLTLQLCVCVVISPSSQLMLVMRPSATREALSTTNLPRRQWLAAHERPPPKQPAVP